MAALWFGQRIRRACAAVRRALWGAVLGPALVMVPGCSELAQPSDAVPPVTGPAYVALAAKHLQSALKDRTSYDVFEISPARWVDSIRGWSWLVCVHFHDHGHLRAYALLIQNNVVVDGRYAVETDACQTQTYTQFDLMTGELGRPTAPVQPPLY